MGDPVSASEYYQLHNSFTKQLLDSKSPLIYISYCRYAILLSDIPHEYPTSHLYLQMTLYLQVTGGIFHGMPGESISPVYSSLLKNSFWLMALLLSQ